MVEFLILTQAMEVRVFLPPPIRMVAYTINSSCVLRGFFYDTMRPMEYIDAHTHVHFPEFNEDRDVVIDRACKAGIGMITVGTDIKLTRAAIDVASHPMIWATAGLHPHEAKQYEGEEAMSKEIQELEESENVVLICFGLMIKNHSRCRRNYSKHSLNLQINLNFLL